MLKAAIFDLDGTLIDSMGFWMSEGIDLLTRYEVKDAIDICERLVPKSMYETCAYVCKNYNLNISEIELRNTWEKSLEDHYLTDVKLKGNVLLALEYLKSRGIKLGIATATKYEMAVKVLTRLNVISYFDVIVTTQMVNKSKDFPDVYLKAAELLTAKPTDCAVFEDAYHGIRTARNALFNVIAVHEDAMKPYLEIINEFATLYMNDYTEVKNMNLF